MGFGKGAIILDSPSGAYFSGQPVNGRLEFELKKEKKFRGIHLSIKGFCSVSWTTQHSRRINDRTEHYTVEHSSYEEYISLRLQLVGGKNAEKNLQPGKFEYPFSFQLPPNCPSSVEGSVGHVRYEIEATMDIPFALDKNVRREFRVLAPFDLNTINCKDPGVLEIDQTYCCWCCTSGVSETLVKIPVRGYCTSQPLPVEVICKNRSTVEIENIAVRVQKELTFRATNNPDTRQDTNTVVEILKGPVAPHTDRSWQLQLDVPEHDVHIMHGCSFIQVDYYFEVNVSPEGCHTDDDDNCEIFFGTVPLTNFQIDAPIPQNPIPQTNMPPQNYVQPMINQPLTANQSYQPNSPYPPNPYPHNTPYPLPNVSPYPNTNSPYPIPQNTPYSGPHEQPTSPYGNPAYPGNAAPYPPNVPPQMGNNPPYPANNPTNLGTNPPYPVNNAAHQGTNSPYPGNNPPPLGNNPPYPVNNPPPLGNNPPYPGNNPTPLGNNPPYPVEGKPGIMGFNMDGPDKASVPLLPPGTVPYPIAPPAGSPYSDASAPEVTTPVSEEKKPFVSEPNNSPYNPEFMTNKKETTTDNK